jgi:hypothetical protein
MLAIGSHAEKPTVLNELAALQGNPGTLKIQLMNLIL